jgi:hypothetical protein
MHKDDILEIGLDHACAAENCSAASPSEVGHKETIVGPGDPITIAKVLIDDEKDFGARFVSNDEHVLASFSYRDRKYLFGRRLRVGATPLTIMHNAMGMLVRLASLREEARIERKKP